METDFESRRLGPLGLAIGDAGTRRGVERWID